MCSWLGGSTAQLRATRTWRAWLVRCSTIGKRVWLTSIWFSSKKSSKHRRAIWIWRIIRALSCRVAPATGRLWKTLNGFYSLKWTNLSAAIFPIGLSRRSSKSSNTAKWKVLKTIMRGSVRWPMPSSKALIGNVISRGLTACRRWQNNKLLILPIKISNKTTSSSIKKRAQTPQYWRSKSRRLHPSRWIEKTNQRSPTSFWNMKVHVWNLNLLILKPPFRPRNWKTASRWIILKTRQTRRFPCIISWKWVKTPIRNSHLPSTTCRF